MSEKQELREEDLREIRNLKRIYNELLKVFKKGEVFFGSNVVHERKLKHIERFKTIMSSMNDALRAIKSYGENISEEEIENGFNVKK